MFRWAIICLVISLIAGGLGLTNISKLAKRLSLIFFALFFLGFLALVGFAYLVSSAVNHSETLPVILALDS
jgi:uncharacterized membrane protein YtjA (UPF0391 family)